MGDEDAGDAADAPATTGNTEKAICEECGETIETTDWYPISQVRDDDGSLHLYPFCSEECQAAWEDEGED